MKQVKLLQHFLISSVTFASEAKKNDDNTIDVTREVDYGLETIRIAIPGVITMISV